MTVREPDWTHWSVLSDTQVIEADRVGRMRRQRAIKEGRSGGYGLAVDDDRALKMDIHGARCERGGGVFLGPNVPWHKGIDGGSTTDLPDFADFIDVKGITKFKHQLVVPVNQFKPDLAYLLVCSQRHPFYKICGWVWGRDIEAKKFIKELQRGRPAHCLKQENPLMRRPEYLLLVGREYGWRLFDETGDRRKLECS